MFISDEEKITEIGEAADLWTQVSSAGTHRLCFQFQHGSRISLGYFDF